MGQMPTDAWAYAQRAADRITGHAAPIAVAKGVLAQWIAENGWTWPPPRRNPGNLARGWAGSFSYPFTYSFPNPQPGNPIVTFATLQGGADCYAAGLVSFPRYAAAVTAARAGDGLGFAVAVCQAGYGTTESAVRSVYAVLATPTAPGGVAQPGGDNVAIRYAMVTATGNHMQLPAGAPLYDRPGGTRVTAMSRAATVPHVGYAGTVGGVKWRAVQVGTGWGYGDGKARPTILYVRDNEGKVVTP